MNDLRTLIHKANILTLEPSEENTEAFLRAFHDAPEASSELEGVLLGIIYDYAIVECWMEPPCTCEHTEDA